MKQRNIAIILATIVVLATAVILIPQKTIEYTEIEHGITIQSPDPNKGTLLTARYYLQNNQTKTVYITPFNYTTCSYYGQIVFKVVGTHFQDQVLKMKPNETIILLQRTYVPRRPGLWTVEALGVKSSVVVEESWVPNNAQLFDDEFCIVKFIETTSEVGLEYWNVTVGPIWLNSVGPYMIGSYTRAFSANTRWNDKIVFYQYAGTINEDLLIEYIILT